MSAGGGAAAGGGHPDFGLSAPNQHDAPISGAELAALDAAMFDTDNMMAATFDSDLGWGSMGKMGFDYDKAKAFGLNFEPKIMSPNPYGGWAAPLGAIIGLSLGMKGKEGDVVSPSVNPHAGFDSGVSGTGIETHGKGLKVSTKELPANITPSIEQMLDWSPLQFDTNFNTNITHPALTPEARELDPNAANKVLDAMGVPWGVNPISSISHSDTVREYAERAAAERALYSQIANQITQAAGQSGGGTTVAGPTGGSTGGGTTGGGNTGGGTTGGGSTGGGTTGGGTTGGGRKPKPPRGGKQDPPPRKPDPINILVKTLLTPKKQMRGLAKHAQESLRQGRMPDFSMLPDFQQDLVRDILNPPKPVDMSNPENRGR